MRGAGIALVIVTYAILVHHSNTLGYPTLLGALLALAPLLLVTLAASSKVPSISLRLSILLVFLIASWWALPWVMLHTGMLFWLQDIGLMMMLFITFARSLFFGNKPLCVHFAEIIHGGELPAAHRQYAHKVTIAWAIFFAMMVVMSTLLFFLASLATWSFFVNFLTVPLIAMMFIAEFTIRRQVLVNLPTGNVLDALRAYLDSRHAH
jgi:uncharacterized membrane protein